MTCKITVRNIMNILQKSRGEKITINCSKETKENNTEAILKDANHSSVVKTRKPDNGPSFDERND